MNALRRVAFLFLTYYPAFALAAAVDASSLQRFIDGVMERSVVAGETVGATVAVVQNDRLLLTSGYGMADVERSVPVESRTVQFRIGSISKTFVWMSVLQLVEAGQLDLDADINTYLKTFKLPTDFTEPVTMRHLMTHTAGFEENVVNLFVSGPRKVGTLAHTLAREVPRRVRAPSNLVSYSNYGAALAGYIVAQVAGQSWDDYVDTHVFRPLGMQGATTRQPVPKDIDVTRARGYLKTTDGETVQGFTYIPLAPAGAGTATAVDMARLMVELLNPRSTAVLSAASKAQMLSRAYIGHPLVNGVTLGLYEMTSGGSRAVGHEGSTLLFNSKMILWPDERIGLFVASNTLGGRVAVNAVVDTVSAYLDFTASTVELQDIDDAKAYLGNYIVARRNHSNFSKLLALTDTVRVDYESDHRALKITDNKGSKRYRRLREGVFQHVGSADRVLFRGASISGELDRGESEQAVQLYFSNRPMSGYTRAELAQTPLANLALLGVWCLLMVGVVLVWPVSSLTHRRQPVASGQRLASLLTYLSVAVVVFFVLQLAAVATGPYELLTRGFSKIPALLWYPLTFVGLLALRLLYCFRVWTKGFWWISRRIHFTLVILADCGLAWWFWYWNLLPETLLNTVQGLNI